MLITESSSLIMTNSGVSANDELSHTSRSFDEGDPRQNSAARDARGRANTAPAEISERQAEDEEVKRAKAMAMAYQSNPNLSVDQAQKMGKSKLIPNRLVQAFQRSDDHGDGAPSSTKSSGKRPFRFDRARNMLKGATASLTNINSANTDNGGDYDPSGIPRLPFRQRQGTPRSPPLSPEAVEGSLSAVDEDVYIRETTTSSTVLPPPSFSSAPPRIRLTALAWKRRGGMGKYSATGAWERRRIELRGSKLFYYKKESDEGDDEDSHSPPALAIAAPPASDDAAEGVVVARRSTWFEQAFTSATSAGSEADPSIPRGEMDLKMEKAVVAATLGHSGAPSPFALSVKCRGETKWKFCFDHHKDQMEWLAALTDVTVQASVDVYNHLLLENADPAVTGEGTGPALFPNAVSAPPGPQQRLWQCELYTVSNERSTSYGDDLEDAIGPTDVVAELEAEELDGTALFTAADGKTSAGGSEVAVKSVPSSSPPVWSVPERNFLFAWAIVNAALAMARASSTSMEGFWYLVALANLGLYLCTVKEAKMETVRVVTATVSAGANSMRATRKAGVGRRRPSVLATNKPPKDKQLAKPGFIPVAGTTSVKLKNPTDPPSNAEGHLFAGWRCPSAEILNVRSPGYSTHKKKQSSPGELYDCAQVEVFESPSRYPDMAPRVQLPKVEFQDDGPKTWRTPDIFVISIALPTDPPKLGRSSSDGGGYTVTMYYTMKQETRDILRRVTADGYDPSKEEPDDPSKFKVNAVRLLEEWCRRAPNDPSWFSRFKVVPNAHNLNEIGMPGWIANYNGKPFLIKRPGVTGFIYQHPELSCLEMDISLHPFPYLAKQGICFMKDSYFKKVLVTFGFVIEGKTDDELPECILGCMQLCYPDPIHAIQASDFFAGRSHRSF